jgi:hypothetical protein
MIKAWMAGTSPAMTLMGSMMDISNPALARMRAGDVALGMIVRLGRSGDIARIAKTSGHDFIFIDGQHALYGRTIPTCRCCSTIA